MGSVRFVFANGPSKIPVSLHQSVATGVGNQIAQAVSFASELARRGDGAGAMADPMSLWRQRQDGLFLREQMRRGLLRADSEQMRVLVRDCARHRRVTADSLLAQVRRGDALTGEAPGLLLDFEYRHRKVLTEVQQPLSYEKLLAPSDDPPPVGARSHRWVRELGQGIARIYRGSSADIPVVNTSYEDEEFEVVIVVAAVETNYFDQLSASYAGLGGYNNLVRRAIRAIREKLNEITFNGATGSRIYGFLNHPNLPISLPTTSFARGAATGEALAKALNEIADYPLTNSGTAFQANRMVTSPRVHRMLHSTKHSTTGGTDLTVAEWFLKAQPDGGIKKIEMAPEMQGAGATANHDIIQVWNDAQDSAHRVMIQGPTALPQRSIDSIREQTVFYAIDGGVVMPNVGNQHQAQVLAAA